MKVKLFDSELKVMNILWQQGGTAAKDIAKQLNEQVGWGKTTTYTVIKKCVDKGAIKRSDKKFICHALITKQEAQELETEELVDKMFDGSSDLLIASLLNRKKLSKEQLENLRQMVADLD